jgi:Ca2+-binding EF-hand superfamily protein
MDRSAVPRSLNDEQIREIKEAFDLFDVDGSGKIDPQELLISLDTLGYAGAREEIRAMIREIGGVKTRALDFSSFLKLVNRTLRSRNTADEIDKSFMRFDDDSTGRISFRNLKRVSLELGEQLTDEELRTMLKAADLDQDGEISREEFATIMNQADIF